MTPPPSPRPQRRSTGLLLAAAALVAGAAGASGTAALWNADGTAPLGLITAGDLDIELSGGTVWHETSRDAVSTPEPIGPDFLARPGDTVTMQQRFTIELQGENMLGLLTVDWSAQPTLPDLVAATYSVRNAAGDALIDDVPLGTSDVIENLHPGTHTGEHVLEVAITFAEDMADRFRGSPGEIADLGDIVIELDQVRTGEGFGR